MRARRVGRGARGSWHPEGEGASAMFGAPGAFPVPAVASPAPPQPLAVPPAQPPALAGDLAEPLRAPLGAVSLQLASPNGCPHGAGVRCPAGRSGAVARPSARSLPARCSHGVRGNPTGAPAVPGRVSASTYLPRSTANRGGI